MPLGMRRRPHVGLVSNLSGIFGKQACALFSNVPNDAGYGYADITSTVAEKDVPLPLNADYAGPATIAGYTVMFNGDVPSHGIAICDTADGERTVVRSDDPALLGAMTQEEFCGRVIEVFRGGRFDVRLT